MKIVLQNIYIYICNLESVLDAGEKYSDGKYSFICRDKPVANEKSSIGNVYSYGN